MVVELGLASTGVTRVVLTDGGEVTVSSYAVSGLCDGQTRDISDSSKVVVPVRSP